MTNRDRAVAAAVELLGTEGIRALTHGRVDERAGLPKGSTSNSFRTRAALFRGVVEAMVSAEAPALDLTVDSPEALVDRLTEVYGFLTGPGRTVTAARLALYIEAAHDADLRDALTAGRAAIEERVRPAFERLGAQDPAFATQLLAAAFEGMFLHTVARHADIDARRLITSIVHAALL